MYLVTGGAGFIGSHLVTRLIEQGRHVRVFDNFSTGKREYLDTVQDQIALVQGDLRDRDAVRQAMDGVRIVFHEATISSVQQSIADPHTSFDVNLMGTLNVLEAARDAGCQRVVFASSASVYGDAPGLPKTESMTPRPLSPYAISKLAGEHLCALFTRIHGLETVALRYFNVFGLRQDPASPYSGVISRFAHALRTGAPPVIYGDGEQTRDFVYVDNVVEANLRAATASAVAGEVFNIASGQSVTLNEVLRMMARLMDVEIAPRYELGRPGDIRHSLADIAEAKRVLGYSVTVPLEVGLMKTLAESCG